MAHAANAPGAYTEGGKFFARFERRLMRDLEASAPPDPDHDDHDDA